MKEKKQTPQERYAAKYKKQFKIDCFTSTEKRTKQSRLYKKPYSCGYSGREKVNGGKRYEAL